MIYLYYSVAILGESGSMPKTIPRLGLLLFEFRKSVKQKLYPYTELGFPNFCLYLTKGKT